MQDSLLIIYNFIFLLKKYFFKLLINLVFPNMFYTIQFWFCKNQLDSEEHFMLLHQISIFPQKRHFGAHYYSYLLNKFTFTFLKNILIVI